MHVLPVVVSVRLSVPGGTRTLCEEPRGRRRARAPEPRVDSSAVAASIEALLPFGEL